MLNARGSVSLGNVHCIHGMRYLPDETSKALSPSKRRAPVTYFRYPGLDADDLVGFLLEKNASRACIKKAVEDLGGVTPCPSVFDDGSDVEKEASITSDDVFMDETLLESRTSTTLLLAQLSPPGADDTFYESVASSEAADVNPFTMDELSFNESSDDRLSPVVATDDEETATRESLLRDAAPQSKGSKLKKRQRLVRFLRSLFRGRKFRRCRAVHLNSCVQNYVVSPLTTKSCAMDRCRKCGIIAHLGVHIC